MADHPNVEIVRKGYDAFVAGDIEWMNEHLHENMVWHEPGNNFLSGDYQGREAVLAHFAKQVQHFIPEFDVHDTLANDDHAIVMATVRAKRHDNQETYEGRYVHIFHIDADGKALESWVFSEDQAAFDQFLQGLS
jgi:ketosteroid isomerase-like protein